MEKINQEKKSLNKPGERFRYGRNTRYSYKRPKYVISQNMHVAQTQPWLCLSDSLTNF